VPDNEEYWRNRHKKLRGAIAAVGDIRRSETENLQLYSQKKLQLVRILRGMGRFDLTGERVLDAGCGIGLMSEVFCLLGAHISGIDASPDAIEAAKARCGGGDFRCGSLVDIDLPEAFDLVFCSDVLYHVVDDANWNRVLGNLAGWTSPSGQLIIADLVKPEASRPAAHVRFRTKAMYHERLVNLGMTETSPAEQRRFLVYRKA
jgi:2-polyprenyl-3-methyl-5-hydroxy-6-metoxy-1,4-benzoquinol methylase